MAKVRKPKWWTDTYEKMSGPVERFQYLVGLSDLSWDDCQDAWFESKRLMPEIAAHLSRMREALRQIRDGAGKGTLTQSEHFMWVIAKAALEDGRPLPAKISAAGRIQHVRELLDPNVYAEDGVTVVGQRVPLITQDQARELLGFPAPTCDENSKKGEQS